MPAEEKNRSLTIAALIRGERHRYLLALIRRRVDCAYARNADTLPPVTSLNAESRSRPLHWPNVITVARLVLLIPFLVCLVRVHAGEAWVRYVALGLLIVMSASDVLDGYIARRTGRTTALGRFLDPLADKLLILGSLFVLAIDPLSQPGFEVPNWVPAVALSKDLLTVVGILWIRWRTGRDVVRPRVLGKVCTAVQLLLIGLVLIAPDVARSIPSVSEAVRVGCWIATLFAAAAWVDYAVAVKDAVHNGDEAHQD